MSDFLHVITIHEQAYRACCKQIADVLQHAGLPKMTPEDALLLMRMPPGTHSVGKIRLAAGKSSTITYNLRKLEAMGFLRHEGSPRFDKRSILYSRTFKGDQLVDFLTSELNGESHAAA